MIYEIKDMNGYMINPSEAFVKKFENENRKKNYEIVDGKFITEIKTYYNLTFNLISTLNVDMITDYKEVIISKETKEEFEKEIRENEDLLISYINVSKDPSFQSKNFLKGIKKTVIKPFLSDFGDDDIEFFGKLDEVIIEMEDIDSNYIIELVKSNPDLEKTKRFIENSLKEMEKLILEKQRKDKEIVVKNQYEMWKILNDRFLNGDFDTFIKRGDFDPLT